MLVRCFIDRRRVVKLTNDGDLELLGLELPESDIDGDTTLTLSLEFVKNPGILEGTLSELSSLLLELLDGTLVNTTTLVDQVTCYESVSSSKGEGGVGGGESLPVVVDLPESTWPITTMLMWERSSLLRGGLDLINGWQAAMDGKHTPW